MNKTNKTKTYILYFIMLLRVILKSKVKATVCLVYVKEMKQCLCVVGLWFVKASICFLSRNFFKNGNGIRIPQAGLVY